MVNAVLLQEWAISEDTLCLGYAKEGRCDMVQFHWLIDKAGKIYFLNNIP